MQRDASSVTICDVEGGRETQVETGTSCARDEENATQKAGSQFSDACYASQQKAHNTPHANKRDGLILIFSQPLRAARRASRAEPPIRDAMHSARLFPVSAASRPCRVPDADGGPRVVLVAECRLAEGNDKGWASEPAN